MSDNKKKTTIPKAKIGSIYQLKVTLLDSTPPIWRRLKVPGNVTLEDLHYIIQWAMGWENCHLHRLIVDDVHYSANPCEMDVEEKPSQNFRLDQLGLSAGEAFGYVYDYGDNWEHGIEVEEILPDEERICHAVCVAGERACPPEDCGGLWGYEEFLKAIKDPNHEEHEEMLDWIGGSFDPDVFDLQEVNRALKSMKLKLA